MINSRRPGCPARRHVREIIIYPQHWSAIAEVRLLMPRFLFQASYTVEGVKGLQRVGGSSRRDAVAKAAQSVGGRLERFYFAFGDHDAFVIADLPDNQSAAAFALSVSAAGGASVRTVVLLTPEEVDAAVKHSIDYRPPLEWEEPRHF
jgi:uncharacterized protein with GYD domain